MKRLVQIVVLSIFAAVLAGCLGDVQRIPEGFESEIDVELVQVKETNPYERDTLNIKLYSNELEGSSAEDRIRSLLYGINTAYGMVQDQGFTVYVINASLVYAPPINGVDYSDYAATVTWSLDGRGKDGQSDWWWEARACDQDIEPEVTDWYMYRNELAVTMTQRGSLTREQIHMLDQMTAKSFGKDLKSDCKLKKYDISFDKEGNFSFSESVSND